MASSRPNSYYWQGLRAAAPFIIAIAPFSVVFGVLAVNSGLSIAQTIGFSFIVVAGASQFAAVQLMTENAHFAVIVATALAVNLRMAMYSAALAPHLGMAPLWQRAIVSYLNVDQTFAMSVARYEAEPQLTLSQRLAYFMGLSTSVLSSWFAGSIFGAVAGQGIPKDLSLEFAVPITFLALASGLLRTVAHWAAAASSVIIALALDWVPLNLGLLIAAGVAMAVGAGVEIRNGRTQ